jgi:hypothetical protein
LAVELQELLANSAPSAAQNDQKNAVMPQAQGQHRA